MKDVRIEDSTKCKLETVRRNDDSQGRANTRGGNTFFTHSSAHKFKSAWGVVENGRSTRRTASAQCAAGRHDRCRSHY